MIKKFETQLKEIEISTLGLDDVLIENTDANFIEIFLTAENIAEQHIIYKEEFNTLKIQFEIPESLPADKVFRKFITERLQRASVVLKIPSNKAVTFFGDEINIEAKSYKGDLNIFIEKGILKLHTIFANLEVRMYAGSLYAVLNNTNINVVSKAGKLNINDVLVDKTYQKRVEKSDKKVLVNSIKANIFLTTK
ncbi:hypothetical protein QWY81_14205 [Polaribacter undariae]|uniref:Adhesin domain-containing protein n=1 Tax=Polaribacter sejongensis TaxID=985043 RepID=A0AAJ1QYD0_9FLAO|nr:hypothetical protein [Polaribacter undariae]MDN3620614.1 hypothetical protein [Polaribacter undariae]UWD31184.1 hypothetical protein NQP51_13690 [Polaribacter undariae]